VACSSRMEPDTASGEAPPEIGWRALAVDVYLGRWSPPLQAERRCDAHVSVRMIYWSYDGKFED